MVIEEITQLVEESVTSEVFGVWFLIGAALVFFMHTGFAMVETDLPEQRMPVTLL